MVLPGGERRALPPTTADDSILACRMASSSTDGAILRVRVAPEALFAALFQHKVLATAGSAGVTVGGKGVSTPMPAPYLASDATLDDLRNDLVYLRHRLRRDKRAADLARPVGALIDQWGAVHSKQLALWDAQTEAQGDIVQADESLDSRVDAVDNDARHLVGGDREDPRYRLYFVGNAFDLKRPVLGDELVTLRAWQEHLATDDAPVLRSHRKALAAELAAADAAVKARDVAGAKNAAFRATGEFAKYVQKIHVTRDRVWSELDTRRTALPPGTARDWASGFFRPRPERAPSAEELSARVAAREEHRALAQQRKEAAQKLREAQKVVSTLKKKKPA